jgi:hypothetical protein
MITARTTITIIEGSPEDSQRLFEAITSPDHLVDLTRRRARHLEAGIMTGPVWATASGWRVQVITLDGRQLYRVTESPALAARLGVPVHEGIDGPGRWLGPVVMAGGRFWAGDVATIEAVGRLVPLAELEEAA